LSGSIINGGTALFRNMMTVLNGGAVSNLTVSSGDELIVSFGGIASGSTVASGGTELVAALRLRGTCTSARQKKRLSVCADRSRARADHLSIVRIRRSFHSEPEFMMRVPRWPRHKY
jgi:autotransporter passenger strand-loop-strand repeat protein